MSHTTQQIGWHAKYLDVVRELHAARLENERLQLVLLKTSHEGEAQSKRLAQVEQGLIAILKGTP